MKYSISYNKKRAVYIVQFQQAGEKTWKSKYAPNWLAAQSKEEVAAWFEDWVANNMPSTDEMIRSKKRKPRTNGVIYVVQQQNADGYVKVGYTNNLKVRLSHLQTGNPYPIEVLYAAPGTAADEAEVHSQIADHRVRNEWYFPAVLYALIGVSDTRRTKPAKNKLGTGSRR